MEAHHSQRQTALRTHRQAGMEIESATLGSGLVPSDHTQAIARLPGGIVQLHRILNDQYRRFTLHPSDRLVAMGLQQNRRAQVLPFAIEEAVIRLEFVAISAAGLGIRRAGLGRLVAEDLHQALRAPGIAQWAGAKFLLSPTLCVQSAAGIQRLNGCRFHTHASGNILHQRIQIDVFYTLDPDGLAIAATALGLTGADPIGGLAAGAIVLGSIDKTFHQPRFQSITTFEIPGDLLGAEGQDPGSQILAVDPGADEKAVHIEHARTMLHTLQSTLNLTSPVTWVDAIQSPAVMGTQLTLTISASDSARFYRLRKQ